MQKIITKTGKAFEVAWAGVATIDGVFRFAVLNSDMSEVFTTFSDTNETEVLNHSYDDTPHEYVGYTVFRGLTLNYQNQIIVALSRM